MTMFFLEVPKKNVQKNFMPKFQEFDKNPRKSLFKKGRFITYTERNMESTTCKKLGSSRVMVG